MNEIIFALLLSLFVFSTVGISQTDDKSVLLDKEFSLAATEKAIVRSETLTIEFVSVEEDSRCPPNVDCIWAGNAKVKVVIKKGNNASREFELNTNLEPRTIEFEGLKIELVSLSNNSNSSPDNKSAWYCAGFLIRKN